MYFSVFSMINSDARGLLVHFLRINPWELQSLA